MFILEIPEDLDKRFAAVAAKLQISKEDLVVQALEQACQDREDYLAALVSYEDYLRKGRKSISFEEFEEKLLLGEELS